MFHVEWLQSALDDLARFWTQADSALRQAITAASHAIEQRLLTDPHNAGESRSGGRRIFIAPPLAVIFRVEADGQTVTVLRVRLSRPRRP